MHERWAGEAGGMTLDPASCPRHRYPGEPGQLQPTHSASCFSIFPLRRCATLDCMAAWPGP